MKKNVIDFTNVSVETGIDEFTSMDVSKAVGNAIHRGTGDLGIDEIARKIYHDGCVTLSDEMKEMILPIIENSNLVIGVKMAVRKLLSNNLK